jgi:uncharacterized protein (DUF2236 family)
MSAKLPSALGTNWMRYAEPRMRKTDQDRYFAEMAQIAKALGADPMQAAIDLLPPWARRMHNLPSATLTKPLIRAGTLGVARTLRWVLPARRALSGSGHGVSEGQRRIIARCHDDADGADPGDCHHAARLPPIGGSLSAGCW